MSKRVHVPRARDAFPARLLGRGITRRERSLIETRVRALLRWQRSLGPWPGSSAGAPDATPFVSVYAGGRLRGCCGSDEGSPGERLSRAFLSAVEDGRYGRIAPQERNELVAVVSYVRVARRISADRIDEEIEPGVDGIAVVPSQRAPAILLPQVARDGQLDARAMLDALAKKSGATDWGRAALFAFTTEDVVVRPDASAPESPPESCSAADQAANWLAGLISASGQIAFGIDARSRKVVATGPMHHGRAAVLLRALDCHGGHTLRVRRAHAWLARKVAAGARGARVEGWPRDLGEAAGTLALAAMARIDVSRELLAIARSEALRSSPWHAAQVVAALGRHAPEPLWRRCVDDLANRPWAPWTMIAAKARGDAKTQERARQPLTSSIRLRPPGVGGCAATVVPETALTALVVEALAPGVNATERTAVRLARDFLGSLQFSGERTPGSLDADLACGAYPGSRIVDFLRCDVTAHVLLALAPRDGLEPLTRWLTATCSAN